jgi:hypothetical protein
MAKGRPEELRPMRRDLRVVRNGHVPDAHRRDHHHRNQPATVHLDQRDETFVANEQLGLAPDARGADRKKRPGNVPPADDPPAHRRMHAVVVLGRKVRDEVAPPSSRCAAGASSSRLARSKWLPLA